jgi:hypothetical protein
MMGRQSGIGTSPWRSSEGFVTFAVAFAVFTVINSNYELASNLKKVWLIS